MNEYAIHNQRFDFLAAENDGVNWFGRYDGFAMAVTSHMTDERSQTIEQWPVALLDATTQVVQVNIPVSMRGEGLALATLRNDWVRRALRSADHQSPYGMHDKPIYSGDSMAIPLHQVSCHRPVIRIAWPISGGSYASESLHFGMDDHRRQDSALRCVPWDSTGVTVYAAKDADVLHGIRRINADDLTIGLSVNRKKANAAARAFKDGWAEGVALRALFGKDAVGEAHRRCVESEYWNGDFKTRARPEFFNLVGAHAGAINGSVITDYGTSMVTDSMHNLLSTKVGSLRSDAPRMQVLDVMFYSGILTTNSGLVEAYYERTL